MGGGFEDSAGDNEDIKKQLREIYGEKTMDAINSVVGVISGILPADSTLWSFTHDYWNRATELAVANIWDTKLDYDPEVAVGLTLLRKNLENYIYDWQSSVDKAINNITSVRDQMVGDCYGDMNMMLEWSGSSFKASESKDTPFDFDLSQIIKNTSKGSTVWIDAREEDNGGKFNKDTSATIYNFGRTSATLIKTAVFDNDTAGNIITIPAGGKYVMSSEESGMYRIDTSGVTLAGPFSKAATSGRAADIIGGLVVSSGNDRIYAVPDTNNEKNITITNTSGTTWTSASLKYVMTYTGLTNNRAEAELCNGSTFNIVSDWNALIQSINDTIDDAARAGEVIWGIFDVAEESNSYLSPSSITKTVDGVNLSVAEQQAIYIQAMMRIADYWTANGGELGNAEFITNIEAVDLIVYGDIYYNGQLWMENAVFTPYLTVSMEQKLSVGDRTSWNGPGFAMVWAQVPQFSQWDGSTPSNGFYLLDLDSGYSMQVEKITKDGKNINDITLSPTIIERYTPDPAPPSDLDDPVKVLDAKNLIMLILIELAVIIFLLGYVFNQPMIGLIAALVVLVIGIMFSGPITNWALGKPVWEGLMPW